MLSKIKEDVISILIPRLINKYPGYKKYFNDDIEYHINPTGKFVIGGPHGDTGLYHHVVLRLQIFLLDLYGIQYHH